MKQLFFGASVVTLLTGIAAANPTPAPRAAAKPPPIHAIKIRVAPADEYFGRLKMSILGIRNTIKDEGLKLDADIAQGDGVAKACAYTEDALHDWEKKYPKDTWIPHTLFMLERVYAKVDSDIARGKAKATMLWLVRDYPASADAKIGRVELAQNKVGAKPTVVDADAAALVPAVVDPATAVVAPAPSASP